MNCPKCGKENENNVSFCAECGARMNEDTVRIQIPVPPVPPVIPQPFSSPVPVVPAKQAIPGEYKPLSAWSYVGWKLLFMLPIAGFVLLIVMSFAPRNKNLKSFARSYWCMALLVFVIALVAAVIGIFVAGGVTELINQLS